MFKNEMLVDESYTSCTVDNTVCVHTGNVVDCNT